MLFASPTSLRCSGGGGDAKETTTVTAQADKSTRKPSKSTEEIVEAMKKLDAKLVAYLAGEDDKLVTLEKEVTPKMMNGGGPPEIVAVEERFREQQLQLFRYISAVRLQMEALTLQPDGTKRMELLQSEIRPIFTVECQLSHELIGGLPRADMFHIMQFESEKFQSLTQCTRFGQEAQRDVRLSTTDAVKETALNLGRIHFTVWWREPGTCLNEMLGVGVLELEELYNASLLEQCKCIGIQRRGVHLASLYFKISLLSPTVAAPAGDLQLLQQLLDKTTLKQCNGDDDDKQTAPIQSSATVAQCGGLSLSGTDGNSLSEANSARSNHSNNNNQLELGSSNFSAETSKVRLLKGFVYASQTRNLEMNLGGDDCFLVCRRFWQDEEAVAVAACADNSFNYQEQFSLLNDEKFLCRVDKKHLQLEIWQRHSTNDNDGNSIASRMVPLGFVRLPLHQFFIAYRDAVITNHLCKGKLPVISIDAWVTIVSCQTQHGAPLGELKCLLAIGSEEQISNLKIARGFIASSIVAAADAALLFPAEQVKTNSAEILDNISQQHHQQPQQQQSSARQTTSDLLDMLQRALLAPVVPPPRAPPPATEPRSSLTAAAPPFKPLQPTNMKSFKFALDIQCASGLPLNPVAKGKKAAAVAKRNAAAAKRFPPNEAPSTYVTFQADAGHGKMYKSHEGAVYATNLAEKSTQPQWQQRFRVVTSLDYLTNPQKHFILKVWKKAATDLAQCRLQPTPMDDAIIGFAALDLSALLCGLHIGGAFTIVDFNGRPNGQLQVRCQPLEDLQKSLQSPMRRPAAAPLPTVAAAVNATTSRAAPAAETEAALGMDAVIDQFESSLDLSHLNLGHAIKRKFSELEEISQRLRTRLLDVTGSGDGQFGQLSSSSSPSQFNAVFDSWQSLTDVVAADEDDDFLEEFERDMNTPPPPLPQILRNPPAVEEEREKNENEEATKLISAEAPSPVGAAADCRKE